MFISKMYEYKLMYFFTINYRKFTWMFYFIFSEWSTCVVNQLFEVKHGLSFKTLTTVNPSKGFYVLLF